MTIQPTTDHEMLLLIHGDVARLSRQISDDVIVRLARIETHDSRTDAEIAELRSADAQIRRDAMDSYVNAVDKARDAQSATDRLAKEIHDLRGKLSAIEQRLEMFVQRGIGILISVGVVWPFVVDYLKAVLFP